MAPKGGNILPVWGNERTMNLNPLILTNITGSQYFKVKLFELKTYHEVIDEIYYNVDHLEPWERGSRKTAGQTGMCGGVRGVGAGGIVSTAYCILFKLYTLKLTKKQLIGLLNHGDSPYIRGLGFMYVRYTQPPQDLFSWFEDYLEDEEEIDVKAGGGNTMTVGEMCRQMLTKLEWYSTMFPRIPVPVQKEIEAFMTQYGPAPVPSSVGGGRATAAAPADHDRRIASRENNRPGEPDRARERSGGRHGSRENSHVSHRSSRPSPPPRHRSPSRDRHRDRDRDTYRGSSGRDRSRDRDLPYRRSPSPRVQRESSPWRSSNYSRDSASRHESPIHSRRESPVIERERSRDGSRERQKSKHKKHKKHRSRSRSPSSHKHKRRHRSRSVDRHRRASPNGHIDGGRRRRSRS